jgi:putative flippase GtrA
MNPVATSGRFGRFAGVGVAGFAVQLGALALLARAGVPAAVATALAVEAAVLHNFVWHERWTWHDRAGSAGRLARLVRFNMATGLLSIVGNVAITMALVRVAHVPLLLANLSAVLALSVVTFAVADRWVFVTPAPVRPRAGIAIRSMVAGGLAAWVVAGGAVPAQAADLKDETVAAWALYVAASEARIDRELIEGRRFLAADFVSPEQARALRAAVTRGDIVVEPVATRLDDGREIAVPDGTIHHWRGYVFIPGVSVDDLVTAVRDPASRHAHRQEDVLIARVLSRTSDSLRLYLKLQRSAIVTVAYNTEHDVTYDHYGPDRASSRSVATRIAEIEQLGTPQERERPCGHDRGFLWRMNSYWRYQAVPGGVVVELESITLSRDLPWGLRTVVRPIVTMIARESMQRTLGAMRARFTTGQAAN